MKEGKIMNNDEIYLLKMLKEDRKRITKVENMLKTL